MTTLELYRKHKKGEIGRDRFLYEVRRDNNLPWVTNITTYDDAVKILKNKGIIRESAEDQFETTLLADLNNILKNPERAKDVLNQAKELAKKHNTTLKDLYGMMASPFGANALLSDVEPNIKKESLRESLQKKKIGIIKEAQFEPQNITTDPLVDRVNPYALKREVEKLLAKETELTNDSYKLALNKAAKKLTTPEAVKQAMFANAESVEKADAKLKTQPVKKNNLKDKANEMKKAKGQAMPKATAAPTKENKKTKKPKGVEIMKEKGVEGSEKVLRETALAELQSFLKKKLSLSEDVHYEYHVGSEVHLPEGGTGKIIEITGGTCTVEVADGSHRDIQMNVLGHAKKKAMEATEHPAMAEKKGDYEGGIKLANKLVDAIEMYNALSDEQKEAEAKRLGVDVLAKLKAAHDDIMNRIHDESNYPPQEEDPNLKEYFSSDFVGNWSTITVSLRDAARAIELFRDASFDNYLRTNVIEMDGTNSYIVKDPDVAVDLYDLFNENGIEMISAYFPEKENDELDEEQALVVPKSATGQQIDKIAATDPTIKAGQKIDIIRK